VAISLKRGKIEKKLLWRAYGKSPMLFRMVLSSAPPGLYGEARALAHVNLIGCKENVCHVTVHMHMKQMMNTFTN